MPHCKPGPRVPTVAEYFKQKLGAELEPEAERDRTHPASPYHPAFHIDTGCGVECRAAIDAAAEILVHLANAYGEPGNRQHPKGPPLRAAVVEAARNIVLCYVYG
jgi:hypothetical protein